MESKAKLLGHPIHQMLIPIPLGLFVAAGVFDIVHMARAGGSLTIVSFWNIVAGVLVALVAAVFGAIDLYHIPRKTRAFRIGITHGVGNIAVTGLFIVSTLLRLDTPLHRPTILAFVLEMIALATATVTAWLGGELVDRLGVGVDDGANLDAPSSLRRTH